MFFSFDSPDRAKQFGRKLIESAQSLPAFPEMGRITPELENPAVREIVHGSYRIIYEIQREPSAIYVLRFWHAARGIPSV